jgi:S-DNA-T family DNA segregation ATPase FtsK/SpoIIIE
MTSKTQPVNKPKKKKVNPGQKPEYSVFRDERIRFISGIALTGFAVYLFFAFVAYLFWWKADQSADSSMMLSVAGDDVRNWSGHSGAWLADVFINRGFGLASFLLPVIIAAIGLRMLNLKRIKALTLTRNLVIAIIIISVTLGYLFGTANGMLGSGPGGAHGYLASRYLTTFLGKLGTALLLTVIIISYIVLVFNTLPSLSLRKLLPQGWIKKGSGSEGGEVIAEDDSSSLTEDGRVPGEDDSRQGDQESSVKEQEKDDFTIKRNHLPEEEFTETAPHAHTQLKDRGPIIHDVTETDSEGVPITITKAGPGDTLSEEEVEKLQENYDPRLDLSRFQMPPVTLLQEYKSDDSFDNNEIIEKKETIVKTLADYNITIKQITATVGPTVTLYEVVPERGVRLAKIKSLENDIALSLSAFGIRIIAPIPGRGTVGIEVPNKNPETVSMRSLIASKSFQESKFELPIAMGRTITNEPLMMDLAKMPHLLVAGATGQGKSVGLNVIIASLLYRRHPAELKFVLVDPKMVELTMYSRIERHYLAKLPDAEEAIITDTQKVVYTLNSLCIEMENRYELMRKAEVRLVREYNEKFIARKLNPEKGHRYLPYIVLIIDEFADLIMTAGKEIEGPIQRLAQLARAIGIHLIIATQRPSANIITGIIKTNFPARLAFRVSSSIDSRTILDQTGAEKLVGRGDMLYYNGNQLIRAQCAFIDTPEINNLTEFIGSQQGYTDAFILPEYEGDTDNGLPEIDLKKRDTMFDDAARLVVQHQQGSTSLIQRKLSLGYNRAGRIVDQLEAAGILGPFEGSKAREVLITDMIHLEQILQSLNNQQ